MAHNEARDALKVGVASKDRADSRLKEHSRRGWVTGVTLDFAEGQQALQAERAVIAFLRACGVTWHLSQRDMPQGGYTETFAHADLADLELQDIRALAELAARLIRRANSSVYSCLLQTRDLFEVVRHYAEDGKKSEARELAERLMSILEELRSKLD
ncbi:hypothetical protein [Streptomyces sp. NPDC055105]|uniref:hypothetical protein n=1 Tax=Streptomyces sp. NPDC055105 TaxID=3365719 RepID=UPI0037D107F9